MQRYENKYKNWYVSVPYYCRLGFYGQDLDGVCMLYAPGMGVFRLTLDELKIARNRLKATQVTLMIA